ncbi:MAG: PKD domain-containing protein, partial [Saprospiraceae bacterium]
PFTSTYTLVDSFNVTLTVTDGNGCSNTITVNNFVKVANPPNIAVSLSNNFGCDPPLIVNFTNNNIEPNVTYSWNFGNGQFYIGANPPSATYSNEGSFNITVIGNNSQTTCRDTLILTNAVTVGASAGFTYTTDGVCDIVTAVFTDTTTAVADSVRWDFGDGMFSSELNPTHTYQDSGCYTVTLHRFISGCETTAISSTCIQNHNLPSVSYTAGTTDFCRVPAFVTFNGISPTATNWSWQFGENSTAGTATIRQPTAIFNNFGIYPIHLTVTDANGCQNSTVLDTVKILETQAIITDVVRIGCAPYTANLSESSISISPITSWQWTVFNSEHTYTATGANPNVAIPDTGIYNVQLIVINALGCRDTAILNNEVWVGLRPEVNFAAAPLVSCVGAEIQFTDLSSNFADTWQWFFGDGNSSNEQSPLYTYNDTGTFSIRLIAGHNGCLHDTIINNLIQIIPPRGSFEYSRVCVDYSTINFFNTSIGADSIFWDFGVPGIDTDTSSALTPIFVFPDTGVYTVKLTAYNFTTLCSHSAEIEIIINTPIAQFALDTLRGCVPLTVNVINNSIFGTQYEWAAVGGIPADVSGVSPSITYPIAGNFSGIQLIVTDQFGCSDTISNNNTIEVGSVTADFSFVDSTICRHTSFTANSQASSLFGSVNQYAWILANALGNSEQQNFTLPVDTTGTFVLQFIASDTWGCSDTVVKNLLVSVPQAAFTTDTAACGSQQLIFTNTSTGSNPTYFWNFGNNTTSTEISPAYAYNQEGTFRPCLTATDEYGCYNTFCGDSIHITNPVALFSADTTYTDCPPLFVNFTNESQNASSYLWDLGNNPSNNTNPQSSYNYPGNYAVQLIAFSGPCSDTLRIDSLIRIGGPTADFSFAIDTSCLPVEVTFVGNSPFPYTYVWDLGDGVLDTNGVNVTVDTFIYNYNVHGSYLPKLIVLAQGALNVCPVLIQSPDTINIPDLVFDITTNDTAFCNETAFVHYGISTTSQFDALYWNFEGGDISISTSYEPVVTYGTPGSYLTQLIVANNFCTDTIPKTINIIIDSPPQTDFSFTPTAGCIPAAVQFTDQTAVNFGSVATWRWDFGDGTNATTQNPTHTFQNAGVYQAQLVVTTAGGCTDSITLPVNVFAGTSFSIANPDTICIGDSIHFEVFTSTFDNIDFSWSNGATLSCTTCPEPFASPMVTTSYTLTLTNADGCITTDSTTVYVRNLPIPTITLSPDTTICCSGTFQIQTGGGTAYQWDNNASGLSCYNCPNPVVTLNNSSETYIVTVFNTPHCSNIDSITISCLTPDNDIVGDDKIICAGGSTTLSVSHGTTPFWSPSTGLSCTNCATPVASPANTTQYIVSVADGPCVARDTLQVSIIPLGGIDAGNAKEVCLGAEVTLNGSGNGTVSWTPTWGLDDVTSLTPNASPNVDTWYRLQTTIGECIQYDSVFVGVIEKVHIATTDVAVCYGDTATLNVSGDADNYMWIAPVGEVLSDNFSAAPTTIPNATNIFTVIGSRSTCEPDTAFANVTVQPRADILMNSSYNYFPGVDVIINPNITGGSGQYAYEWLPNVGLSCYNCSSPSIQIQQSGWYQFLVTDLATGCQSLDSTYLNLLKSCGDELIFIPNAFSPNGDSYNDVLKIQSNIIEQIFTFQIFDRWGEKLFETSNINEGWDGNFQGKPMRPGVFVYYIEFACRLDGTKVQKMGDVTLLR